MKVEKFSYRCGKRTVFDNVDLYFEDARLNFILGEKNTGKSILTDHLADVDGCRGDNFIGFPPVNEIAYLSQGNSFNTELTVSEILDFMRQLNKINDLIVPEEITKILDSKFGQLTSCESRILLVFINIMIDRELYILDEPDAGVDLKHSQEMFAWFRELTELDKTIIVTTHKLDNIQDVDNVNYLKNPQEILSDTYLKIKSRMAF